jgi:hypothetical protein
MNRVLNIAYEKKKFVTIAVAARLGVGSAVVKDLKEEAWEDQLGLKRELGRDDKHFAWSMVNWRCW